MLNSKKIIISFFCLLFLMSPLFFSHASYNFLEDSGLEATAKKTGHEGLSSGDDAEGSIIYIVSNIVYVALGFVGIIFLILAMYGGFIWMTAQGNQQHVDRGKKIITDAILGVVIVFASYAFVWFILNAFAKNYLKNA